MKKNNSYRKIPECLFFIFLCVVNMQVFGQTEMPLDSIRQLKNGEKMPDIILGDAKGENNQPQHISDYKGKLVILDFWSIGCTSCIQSFPKMRRLQKLFGDRIKIFFVDAWETREQINLRLKNYQDKMYLNEVKSSDNIIADAGVFKELFPYIQFVPHHVWIGKDGDIIGSGASENTNERKIRQYLNGEDIVFMNNGNSSLKFNKDLAYYKLLASDSSNHIGLGYTFSVFNNEYAATYSGEKAAQVVDTLNKTIRDTYINLDVLSLYRQVFSNKYLNPLVKVAYSPNRNSSDYWLDFVTLPECFDTLKLTSRYKSPLGITDDNLRNSKFCYEQITPSSWSENKRMEYMLDNLNKYFENKLGIRCTLKSQKVNCYSIIRTSKIDRISTKFGYDISLSSVRDTMIAGRTLAKFTNFAFSEAGSTVFTRSLFTGFSRKLPSGASVIIIDDTGFAHNRTGKYGSDILNFFAVDMVIPKPDKLASIEDLRQALLPYDLDVVQISRMLNYITFTDCR